MTVLGQLSLKDPPSNRLTRQNHTSESRKNLAGHRTKSTELRPAVVFSPTVFTELVHEQDFEVRLEYVQSVKKNGTRLESPLDFVSGISRPQKRDQTLKYNEKYFGLFENF